MWPIVGRIGLRMFSRVGSRMFMRGALGVAGRVHVLSRLLGGGYKPSFPFLDVKLIGAEKLLKTLATESRRQKKAVDIAVKHEGIRLMRLLKDEIKRGAPGGSKFEPLTYLSRSWGGKGRLGPNKPLRRLAGGVQYHVAAHDPFEMHIGWVGPRVSKSSKRIAKLQQEGFVSSMPAARRAYFIRKAGGLGKRSVARRYLFLMKKTQSFKTPARPIMEPYWNAHKGEAWRNIQRNYRLKLKGQRI